MEAALASPSIPPEIVTTLLNLAEFMEHDDKTLPLDARRARGVACCWRQACWCGNSGTLSSSARILNTWARFGLVLTPACC